MPIIKKYAVDKNKWLTKGEFDEVVVLVNVLPGPSVVQALSFISIKLLGKWMGTFVTILGILPSLLFVLGLYIGASYLPTKYLYVINVGVISAIVGMVLAFGYRYIKMSKNTLSLWIWVPLFIFTIIFIIFIPSPWNIASVPIIIVILVIYICHLTNKYKRKDKR